MPRALASLLVAAALAMGAPMAPAATATIDAPSAARLSLVGPPRSATGSALALLGDLNGDGC